MKGTSFTRRKAFTLVELLVSMAIISILLLVLLSITDSTRKTWLYTTNKIQEFREAREAFEAITRRLSQATLNTYWDYHYPNNDPAKAPDSYIRQSELRFISGSAKTLGLPISQPRTHATFFQAPLGYVSNTSYKAMGNLLNTWGYFVEYSDDSNLRPSFISSSLLPFRNRFRLMEMMEPSESMTLYQAEVKAGGNTKYKARDWFTTPLPNNKQVLAENIIALVILPKLSPADQSALNLTDDKLAPSYLYDSTGTGMTTLTDPNLNPTNQLPPVVQVTMVALDEASASRMRDADAAALQSKLDTLFVNSKDQLKDLRRDATNYPDVASDPSLEGYLIKNKMNYRVFTTSVSIKAAKWSRSQKN